MILASNSSNSQNILRCNNDPTVPLTTGMYRTAQEAHDAANVGDIIYLEPSLISYGNLAITKTLKIYGNGYFHNENSLSNQNWNKKPSILGNVQINNAPNTLLEGISVGTNDNLSSISIGSINVTIKRCKISYIINLVRHTTSNPSGAKILECFGASVYAAYTDPNNWLIENAEIKNNIGGGVTGVLKENDLPILRNFVITENTEFSGVSFCENCTVQNNIFRNPSLQGLFTNGMTFNSTASNNLCIFRPCIQGTNNIDNLSPSDLYNLPSGANPNFDNSYIIKDNSLAKTAGLGSIEAGAFGGSSPYKLSGLPSLPQITSYSETTSNGIYTANHPMSVTISVKSNN
jgi:hypothetical protein